MKALVAARLPATDYRPGTRIRSSRRQSLRILRQFASFAITLIFPTSVPSPSSRGLRRSTTHSLHHQLSQVCLLFPSKFLGINFRTPAWITHCAPLDAQMVGRMISRVLTGCTAAGHSRRMWSTKGPYAVSPGAREQRTPYAPEPILVKCKFVPTAKKASLREHVPWLPTQKTSFPTLR